MMALSLSCSGNFLILTIIYLVMAFLLLTVSILIIFHYVRFMYGPDVDHNLNKKIEKPPKTIINIGLIFCVLAIITTIFDIMETFALCANNQYWMDLTSRLVTETYICQLASLMMLWLTRIQFALHNSIFRLSQTITIIYPIMGFIVVILASLATWLPLDDTKYRTREIMWLICYGVYFLMLYILNHMFVYKLYCVYRRAKDKAQINAKYFITIITKIMILNFVSIMVTVIAAVSIAFYGEYFEELDFFHTYSFLLDSFTNIFCVILSYSYYTTYYDHICGACHRCCILCGAKIIGHNPHLVELQIYVE